MSVTGGHLVRDVRFGLRALRKTPAFTLGAIATIALTVGATTAIFSVVYGVLLRQLPYRDVQQVFWLWSDRPGRDRAPFNVPDFIDYRNASRTLSGFAGFFAYGANLSDEAAAERVQGIRATGNLFDVLGAQPRLGRLLQSADERPGADHVVVLGEPFWVRRFGADPRVVGRTIRLNSELYTVVGILASGFALPIRDVEFVLPFAADQDPRRGTRSSLNFINGVGRLGEHVSMAQASGELTAIANRLRKQFPIENATKRGVRLVPVIDGIVGPFRTALVTLLAAVGSVLLIACANLANLMLTRAMGRRRELALQLALGSSRLNVVRQVLVEALMIAGAGGLLGILIAQSGVVRCRPRSAICARRRARSPSRRQPRRNGWRATHSWRADERRSRSRGRAADCCDAAGEEFRDRGNGGARIRSQWSTLGASDAASQAIQHARRHRHVPARPQPATVDRPDHHEYGRDHTPAVNRPRIACAIHC